MSYRILIAREVKDAVDQCQLPRELRIQVYSQLQFDLAADPASKCFILPGRSPRTYVYRFTLEDAARGLKHHLTFWLTEGKEESTLVARQVAYSVSPEGEA